MAQQPRMAEVKLQTCKVCHGSVLVIRSLPQRETLLKVHNEPTPESSLCIHDIVEGPAYFLGWMGGRLGAWATPPTTSQIAGSRVKE